MPEIINPDELKQTLDNTQQVSQNITTTVSDDKDVTPQLGQDDATAQSDNKTVQDTNEEGDADLSNDREKNLANLRKLWKTEQGKRKELEARLAKLENGDPQKGSNSDSTVEARIKALEDENQALKDKALNTQKSLLFTKLAAEVGFDPDLVQDGIIQNVLEKQGVEYDPEMDEYVGFEEAVEALKESRPKLFSQPTKAKSLGLNKVNGNATVEVDLEKIKSSKDISYLTANYDKVIKTVRSK